MIIEQSYSLLWEGKGHQVFEIGNKALQDLNITALFKNSPQDVPLLLKSVTNRIEDIKYRQELLQEFVGNPTLFDGVKYAIQTSFESRNKAKFAFEKESTLYNLVMRIEEAAEVMVLVEGLLQRLLHEKVTAKGLLLLKDQLIGVVNHPLYEAFKTDVERVKAMVGGVKSIKVGINLDGNLKPVSAMLLSLHDHTFSYTRFMKKTGKVVQQGVKAIASIPRKMFFPDTVPLPVALNSLEKMIEPAMKQLIIFCDQFIDGLISTLAALKGELPFYEMGIKLHDDLIKAGFMLCCPEIIESGATTIEAAYNMNLAFEFLKEDIHQAPQQMVYNNLTIDGGGNIFILTGANRGGKTTFTQALGQIFWLGHLGFYVPASRATLRLIDGLYVHFPNEESQTDQQGRLGDECKRFSELYEQLTPRSLLLMNESFSGTSHLESLTIATEAIKAVKAVGATALFNTHLHELGALVEAINLDMGPQPKLISLVTGSQTEHQSFTIHEGPPLGQSYANDIATKYGMTFEQLILA